ncbi:MULTISPECIES: LacI family DNA-binding transcriptional regulator [Mycobacteriaceae]|uniref:LacI family DNA-binding transcriptional regulator n=1 Tax=Mycobacteriaceae TaxID=1762 RepID=UPI0002D4FFAA|nr:MULTISPECIES: LacI family DNA-binding transcriptional regulator [Mycobacteriaceae]AMO05289.1 LacI family transcriptional regulator [Mycolicibacterium neoaurum]KUM10063.1 LacI family transcriptional regulator [Mycolicibacterium neoaurum]
MAARRVTIVEIAQHVGLSKTTVSDALHGGGRVSPATAAKVAAAARELGYVTNRAARQLRGRSVGAFGIYIPPIARNFNFYMEFAFGAAHGSAEHDADLTLFARDAEVGPRHFQVDGVLAVDPLPGDPMLQRLVEVGIPMVTAGRPPESLADAVAAVIEAPHSDLARLVLDHLRQCGYRRPAFVGSDRRFYSSWADDVRQSYLDWCATHSAEPSAFDCPLDATLDELRAAVRSATAPADVDALVCAPQGFAGRAIGILETADRHVGSGFGLASLSSDPTTELSNEQITAVDLAPWTFGRDAVNLLAAVVAGESLPYLNRFEKVSIREAGETGRKSWAMLSGNVSRPTDPGDPRCRGVPT